MPATAPTGARNPPTTPARLLLPKAKLFSNKLLKNVRSGLCRASLPRHLLCFLRGQRCTFRIKSFFQQPAKSSLRLLHGPLQQAAATSANWGTTYRAPARNPILAQSASGGRKGPPRLAIPRKYPPVSRAPVPRSLARNREVLATGRESPLFRKHSPRHSRISYMRRRPAGREESS
jgi:hypothetical protein